MGLLRPHDVTVSAPVDQKRPDGASGIHAQAGETARSVLIVPMNPGKAFEQFGVELTRPSQLFDDADSADLYRQAGEVVWNGRTYVIRAAPSVYRGIGGADHMSVLLEEVVVT